MLASDEAAAVLKALDSARGVRHAGAGLVVVLSRGPEVAATLHWRAAATVTTMMAEVAQSLGTNRAVLIVVGSTRVAGPIIVASDAVANQLIGAGLVVTAHIHVRALADGGMTWTDLSSGAAHDGSTPHQAETNDRPARIGRDRIRGPSRFLRRR
ncbi:hypothetical protein [Nocardia sp. CA-120079]|uniref:hypothetical protein n=1 Tax=Nocardia sp. CA-120079 TaxID=3239974 RepID=UPI003D99F19B